MTAKPRRKTSQAPKGRDNPAKGKRGTSAALDASSPQEQSPEGAGQDDELPGETRMTCLGELKVSSMYGPRFSSDDYADTGVFVLRTSDISESGKVNTARAPRISLTTEELERYRLVRGDLLVTRTGSLGTVAVFDDDVAAIAGAYLIQYRLNAPLITSTYVLHALKSPEGQRHLIGGGAGVGRPNLNAPTIDSFRFHLPPEDDQRRIVAEIEKQFTRLEAGVAALKRAQASLKRYRAAVLKAACEGKLVPTEAELAQQSGSGVPPLESGKKRQDAASTFESGPQLLARILTERRQNWQGRGKYQDPVAPDPANVPACIPEGWACSSVDQIAVNLDGRRIPLKSADRDKRSGPYPYYGASGIIDDIDDFLFDGEYLLIAEDGANLLSRSTPIAFKATGKFWVNNHAHIVQTLGGIPVAFLAIFLNGKDVSFSVTGSAQPKLTQASLNKMPVPLPPLAEQTRIVAEVERRMSVVEELETVVTANLQRATRLRQSILQKAFTGTP